jgi:hypothetical protein
MENNKPTKKSEKKNMDLLRETEKDMKDDLAINPEYEKKESSGINNPTDVNEVSLNENVVTFPSGTVAANSLDGYYVLPNELLPDEGKLYPEYWKFAYRCPEASEVANFSTVTENDQAGMIQVIEDLIKKCFVIYDTKHERIVDPGEILDGHRTYMLLKLREVYLPGQPLKYATMCSYCHEPYDTILTAEKLQFKHFSDEFYNNYDGRIMTHVNSEEGIEIKFYVPTITITSKIFKYIVKVYRNQQTDKNHQKEDKSVYDKLFLLLSPYLFEYPSQTINEIKNKYLKIKKNDKLLQEYLSLVGHVKFNHEEDFVEECPHCGSQEESAIRFPGGFQNLFIRESSVSKY